MKSVLSIVSIFTAVFCETVATRCDLSMGCAGPEVTFRDLSESEQVIDTLATSGVPLVGTSVGHRENTQGPTLILICSALSSLRMQQGSIGFTE